MTLYTAENKKGHLMRNFDAHRIRINRQSASSSPITGAQGYSNQILIRTKIFITYNKFYIIAHNFIILIQTTQFRQLYLVH